MKVAIAQLISSSDKQANLQKAKRYIEEAKQQGADFIILPEMYMSLTKPLNDSMPHEVAEPLDGPFVSGLKSYARENGIYCVCGVYETAEGNRAHNTIVLIGRDGELLQSYRKTHLYDAFSSKESSSIAAGDRLMEPVTTEFGKIGLFVCYELRFPEIARALTLKGADILIVPAGWYAGPMKEEHWITLLKARAIENTVFICSSNQTGNAFSGRSLIVDPMGAVLADAGEEEGLHIREIDVSRIGKVREKLPSVTGRREGLYL